MELKVLAVLGKLLTGPWMKRFYNNQEDSRHHMDAFRDIKACYGRIEMCLASSDIIHLSEVKREFFEDPVIHAPSEEAIWKEDVESGPESYTGSNQETVSTILCDGC